MNAESDSRTTDLVARLRSGTFDEYSGDEDLKLEAAERIEKLRAALERYGEHDVGCVHGERQPCNCGLDEAIWGAI